MLKPLAIALFATLFTALPRACLFAADEAPVVLLTGFQPFGPGRPANPSWEGIKQLDGKVVHGRRLMCREMKVEWGAPLEHLSGWIDELQPEAVFSFGQGGASGFTIETLARNRRAAICDNRDQLPPTPHIVADGPAKYEATVDAEAIVEALDNDAAPVRISTDAGHYLCEETLYTLEHLKATRRFPGDVMFCHVPPLGARINGKAVDTAFVQRFVERLLDSWAQTVKTTASVGAPATTALRQAAPDPREQEVRDLIDRYFLTWNAKDVDRYGQCFMPQAAIQLMDPNGRLTTLPLRAFLETQREAHRAGEDLHETPEHVEVRLEGRIARAIVHWKLVAGERVQWGYDHFTLVKVGDQWRIANLIFYETQGEEGR
jgi:pyroglutamyl-peptidase